jgi:hypothetical protein
VASTTLILGAGTNRSLQGRHGMRPPLTHDLYNGLADSDQNGSQFKVYLLTIN